MQQLWNWLRTYNTSHHIITLLAVALPAAFYGYPPFNGMVLAVYNSMPHWITVLIGTGTFLFGLYKTGALTGSKPSVNPIAAVKLIGFFAAGLGMLARCHRVLMLIALFTGAFACCCLMTGCEELTWLNDALNLMPVLVASAASIVSVLAALTGNAVPAAVLAEISAWSTKVEAGLKNIEALVAQYKTTPGESLLAEIEAAAQLSVSDISSFSTIVGVPAALAAKLQSVAQLILTQLEAWLSLLPVFKATATANTATSPTPVPAFAAPVTHKAFSSLFNATLQMPTGDDDVDQATAKAKLL